ncbi:hypothetical protein D3C78_1482700 [compost metagenome]
MGGGDPFNNIVEYLLNVIQPRRIALASIQFGRDSHVPLLGKTTANIPYVLVDTEDFLNDQN